MQQLTKYAQRLIKVYVYQLRDPRNGKVFYVGKGVRNRAYQHARDAIRDSDNDAMQSKSEFIREMHADGFEPIVEFVKICLTDFAARELEGDLICAYGLDALTNARSGDHNRTACWTAEEINAWFGGLATRRKAWTFADCGIAVNEWVVHGKNGKNRMMVCDGDRGVLFEGRVMEIDDALKIIYSRNTNNTGKTGPRADNVVYYNGEKLGAIYHRRMRWQEKNV